MWLSSQQRCQPTVTLTLASGLCGAGLCRLSPLSPKPEDRPSPQALKGGFIFAPVTRAETDTLSGLLPSLAGGYIPLGVGGLRGDTQSSLPAMGPGPLCRPWGAPHMLPGSDTAWSSAFPAGPRVSLLFQPLQTSFPFLLVRLVSPFKGPILRESSRCVTGKCPVWCSRARGGSDRPGLPVVGDDRPALGGGRCGRGHCVSATSASCAVGTKT